MRTEPRHVVLAATLAIATLATGCSSDEPVDPPPGAAPSQPADAAVTSITSTRVAKFDGMITALSAIPDSSDLLVAERSGIIRRLPAVQDGDYTTYGEPGAPLIDITNETTIENERGLLGLDVTADGKNLVFVHTATNGDVTIRSSPMDDLEATPSTIAAIPHPLLGHNGGDVTALPNGEVLVSIGDMHVSDASPPYAQDPALTLGGILRIPASLEPFTPTNEDMVARGLRNPWRMHLDETTNELWIADVGDAAMEEVNRTDLSRVLDGPQLNYGWPYLEGTLEFDGPVPEGLEVESPFLELPRTDEGCAVIGGAVYRGSNIPGIAGDYLYGDACSGNLGVARLNESRELLAQEIIGTTTEWIVAFDEDASHELYLLGSEGGLYRIDPQGWDVADNPATTEAPAISTTTAPPTLAADACGISAVFIDLNQLLGLDDGPISAPDELEQSMTSQAASLAEKVALLPPELAADGAALVAAYEAVMTDVAADNYQPSAATLEYLDSSLSLGQNEFAEFPRAIQRIGAAEGSSC